MEHSVYYYLFTLLFQCIDQREKNAFPTWIAAMSKWIWLFYDADSTLGIDNKGKLTFGPFLEDTDFTEAGDPVFNGQANVFWNNLRVGFASEIETMYQGWRTNDVLSYEIVKGLFDDHQGKWPEAIFNEDGYFKYLQPWIEDKDGQYLTMNLGKKELQRAWWLFNRFRYMDSKFVTGTSMENRIMIRAHEKANIFLKSYVKMYGNVFFNALRVSHRMEAGQEYEFAWAASGAEDAVIGINDADLLTSLGDLSGLMVETIDLSKATHLTHLYLGNATEGYENKNLLSLTLGNNTLLKVIDVRNCTSLSQSVDTSGCTNVEEIYFDNTAITGISLPNGGVLKKLHLPSTVTNLTLKNQVALREFVMPSYMGISTLWLENNSNVIDPFAILDQIPDNSRVRLIGLSFTADSYQEIADFIARLDSMRGLDENGNNVNTAQVSGTIYLEEVSQGQLNEIAVWQSRYPSLTVMYSRVKTYTVRFWVDGVLCQEITGVKWGENVVYTGDTPTRENADETEDWAFIGWDPLPENVTADMDCHAVFKNNVSMARLLVQRTIKGEYVNARVTSVGESAFRGATYLTSIDLPYVLTAGARAFRIANGSLLEINLPSATTIGDDAFNGCNKLTEINLPCVTAVTKNMLLDCSSLVTIDLGAATSIGNEGMSNAYSLTTLILRSETLCTLKNQNAMNNNHHFKGTVHATYNPDGLKDGYIYVPRALVDSYKSATNWSAYATQFRAIEDYPEICGGEV